MIDNHFNKYLSRQAPDIKAWINTQKYLDVYAKQGIQIQIRQDSECIWINIDGVCAMRIFNPDEKPITIEDNRK